jgi:anti-anti-sigma factor
MTPQMLTRYASKKVTVCVNIVHLDDSTSEAIKQSLLEIADRIGSNELHLDLGRVESMTSATLAMLIGVDRRLKLAGSRLLVLNVNDNLFGLFRLTRLDTILDVCPVRPGAGREVKTPA